MIHEDLGLHKAKQVSRLATIELRCALRHAVNRVKMAWRMDRLHHVSKSAQIDKGRGKQICFLLHLHPNRKLACTWMYILESARHVWS